MVSRLLSPKRGMLSVRGERLELGEGQAQQRERAGGRGVTGGGERALEGGGVVLGLDDEAGVEVVPLRHPEPRPRARHLCGALGGAIGASASAAGATTTTRGRSAGARAPERRAEERNVASGGERPRRRPRGSTGRRRRGHDDGWRAPGCRRARSSSSRGACATTEADRDTRGQRRECSRAKVSRGSSRGGPTSAAACVKSDDALVATTRVVRQYLFKRETRSLTEDSDSAAPRAGASEGILAPLAVSRAVSHPRFAPLEPPEPRVSRRALARGGRTVVASALPMSASESDRRKAEIERLFEEFAPKFPGAPEITAEQLRRDITNGAKPVVLVDVRTEDEQDVSVIKSALRKPEFEARKEEFRELPRRRRLLHHRISQRRVRGEAPRGQFRRPKPSRERPGVDARGWRVGDARRGEDATRTRVWQSWTSRRRITSRCSSRDRR